MKRRDMTATEVAVVARHAEELRVRGGADAVLPVSGRLGTRYAHTFLCDACPRTCTMETVTTNPFPLSPDSRFHMLCPFRRPGAIWKAGSVETLTP